MLNNASGFQSSFNYHCTRLIIPLLGTRFALCSLTYNSEGGVSLSLYLSTLFRLSTCGSTWRWPRGTAKTCTKFLNKSYSRWCARSGNQNPMPINKHNGMTIPQQSSTIQEYRFWFLAKARALPSLRASRSAPRSASPVHTGSSSVVGNAAGEWTSPLHTTARSRMSCLHYGRY